MRRRTSRRDERGQVTTAIVLSVTVALVAVAVFGVVALARGADERSRSQSAADAAVLAGAESLEEAVPALLGSLRRRGDLRTILGCGMGRAAGESFAARNDATLVSYCYDWRADRIRASVRMNRPVTEDVGPATAKAEAESGLRFDGCTWTDTVPPPPTPPPPPPPPPTPSPPATSTPTPSPPPPLPPQNYTTTLRCGPLRAIFDVDGSSDRLSLASVDLEDLDPRLIR